jgi:hypothetical protein
MTQEQEITQFNRMLDITFGIGEAGETAQQEQGQDIQRLLQVATLLAAEDFRDELRPVLVLRRQAGRKAQATSTARWVLPRRRAAFVLMAVLALTVATLLAVGPERALAALGRLLGYVPGVGFVEDAEGFRAIPAPVSQEREGVALVVEQALADSQRTIIVYKVDGLSLSAANSQGEDAPTGSRPTLRLPDGTALDIVEGGGRGWGSGYQVRLVYPPLPPEVEAVTLEIPRLMDMPAGAAPENWEIPLRFVPAPAGVTVIPVFDQETAVPTGEAATAGGETDAGRHGITLQVERSVPLDGGYLVEGSLRWDERYPAEQGVANGWDMQLTDASGREIPSEPAGPDDTGILPYVAAWAYRTADASFSGPLTFTMGSVNVTLPEPVSFRLDLGTDPHKGQTWDVGQEIDVLGFPVRIVSAQYLEWRGMQGLELEIEADPALQDFQMDISGAEGEMLGNTSAGGSHPDDSGHVIATVLTDGPISGAVTLTIRSVGLRGPWSAVWNPPAGTQPAPESTPIPEACLSLEGWRQLAAQGPITLPQSLAGRVVGYGPVNGSERYVVYTANLDGSDLRVLGEGTWPAISPDGTRTAYSGPDGLDIAANATGQIIRVPGTVEGDYHPLWSPDGTQIAFVRIADLNIYVMNTDGSGLRQVTRGVEYELLVGWSPDGAKLYYAGLSEGGQILKAIDLATGEVEGLFTVGPKDVPSISPDGEWVAYADRVFGDMGYGLFVSPLDGSSRRLLAQLEHWTIAGHLWSPDGNWLLTSVSDADQMFAVPMPALIQVNTCQVIPLPWLTGYVQGWAP